MGSRGGRDTANQLWWKGPSWLTNQDEWPQDIVTIATPQSRAEAKITKEVFNAAVESTDQLDKVFEKFSLSKAIRINAWISRFTRNCQVTKEKRKSGPLTTQEINDQHAFWEKRAQATQDEKMSDDKQRLGVQRNEEGVLVCKGQFERMVGLVKSALYKSIGNGCLSKSEIQDVLLDIEVTLNNRPLGYQKDDVQMPTLTPNSLQFVGSTHLPELEQYHEVDPVLRKRAKYLKKCKDHTWSRWTKEYLRALRERHNLKHVAEPFSLAVGDVAIIASEERNRGKWPLGIVKELYKGRDGVIRAVKLKTANGHLERAVNHLYPLELSCDVRPSTNSDQLNPKAPAFRPTRDAAVAARLRVQELASDEEKH